MNGIKEIATHVTLVIPAYNEERNIEANVKKVRNFLNTRKVEIVIADNGCTDNTRHIASLLSKKYNDVRSVSLHEKGKGRALKRAWKDSKTELISYMDTDLPFTLQDYVKALEKLEVENADLVVGSRTMAGAYVERPFIRGFLSRIYNLLVKILLGIKVSDCQCGLKVLRKAKFLKVLDKIEDNNWFFDTELIFRFQQAGYLIKEVPVHCKMTQSTKVAILRDGFKFGISILRLFCQRIFYPKTEGR